MLERLSDYISTVDRGWSSGMRGAAPEDIDRYATLAGFEVSSEGLPETYDRFLRAMGGSDGGLFKVLGINAKIASVVRLYEDFMNSEPESLNPDLPVIALYLLGDQVSFERTTDAKDPPVVDSSFGQGQGEISSGWEAFMMQAAVLYVEPRRLPIGRWFSSSVNSSRAALRGRSIRGLLDDFAEKNDLIEVWPSDRVFRIAIAERGSMVARIGARGTVMLHVFSSNEGLSRRVEDMLAPDLGLKASGALRWDNGILSGA